MKTIRAFIAIALPAGVKALLWESGQQLAPASSASAVRWVKPEAMHLTLRFLGDIAIDQLPQIGAAMDEMAAGRKPFTLRVGELGCFPNPRRPRVIWAGVSGADADIQALKAALDRLLEPLGWPAESQGYQPHLTLGRVKDRQARVSLPWGEPLQPLPLPVTAVHLIESQLRPAGPLYSVRYSSVLEG